MCRGSFTGATVDKAGMFEHAHGGTLFLDEIGDMPLARKPNSCACSRTRKCSGWFATPRKVDVRVIAATNRDLRAAFAEKRFREDLFYRLSMVEIHVPALADRKEDLPLLERFHLKIRRAIPERVRGLNASRSDRAGTAFLARQRTRTRERHRPRRHDDDERYDRRRGSAGILSMPGRLGNARRPKPDPPGLR